MDRDPVLALPRVVSSFPKGAAELWIQALDRPDAETKVTAAQSIALAHRQGMAGLNAAILPLTRLLDRPDQHPIVRLAVAQHAGGTGRSTILRLSLLRDSTPPTSSCERSSNRLWPDGITNQCGLSGSNVSPIARHINDAICSRSSRSPRSGRRKRSRKFRRWSFSRRRRYRCALMAARALGVIQSSGLEKLAAELSADKTAFTAQPGGFWAYRYFAITPGPTLSTCCRSWAKIPTRPYRPSPWPGSSNSTRSSSFRS